MCHARGPRLDHAWQFPNPPEEAIITILLTCALLGLGQPGAICDRGGEALPIPRGGQAVAPTNVELGKDMAERMYGWTGAEWVCTYEIANHESGWDERAWNRQSGASDPALDPFGAYGIPQSHPPIKLAAAGPDWRTNPHTQIRWFLRYLKVRWGTPCAAWAHWQSGGAYTY